MHRILLTFILIITILTGCSREFDSTLLELNDLLETNPDTVLFSLNSIDYSHLSPRDRHFYDFINIKANDKAYQTHKSDSLILDVIKFMSKNGSKVQYAEALYYGGRVYKDLGDYQNAIYYFQSSLDKLSGDANLNLKANILSQYGRLFNELRLTDEATDCLEQAIEIDKQLNDTLNLVYDLQLLGHINLSISNLSTAEKLFKEALTNCHTLPASCTAITKMYIAETKRRLGNLDSALFYIKNIIYDIPQQSRNTALAMTAKVYYDAGLNDSTLFYAKKLVNSDNKLNKKTGYEILLSSKIIGYNTPTEINQYIEDYRRIIEMIFDDNNNRLAIEQIARHNYEAQQQLRIKAERLGARYKYVSWVTTTSSLVLAIFVVFLLYQGRKRNRTLLIANKKLKHCFSKINKLKQQLENNEPDFATQTDTESLEDFRERLLLLYETNPNDIPPLPDNLSQSDIYNSITTNIRQEKSINENDWDEIKNLINTTFPSFKPSLVKLSAGKISEDEFRTALLIKLGITTSNLAKLLAKSKGGIISRRHSMSLKMFDKKIGVQAFDIIIKLL